MSIFDSAEESQRKVNEQSASHALSIATGLALPVTAQSVPLSAIRSRYEIRGILLFFCYVIGAVLVVFAAGSGNDPNAFRRSMAWLALAAIGGAVAFYLIKGWIKRHTAYVDPRVSVEVGPDGVAICSPAGEHRIAFDAVEASLTSYTHKDSVHFLGLKLETALGMQALEDGYYTGGRNAAAAIVQGMARAREVRERKKIEGIGS